MIDFSQNTPLEECYFQKYGILRIIEFTLSGVHCTGVLNVVFVHKRNLRSVLNAKWRFWVNWIEVFCFVLIAIHNIFDKLITPAFATQSNDYGLFKSQFLWWNKWNYFFIFTILNAPLVQVFLYYQMIFSIVYHSLYQTWHFFPQTSPTATLLPRFLKRYLQVSEFYMQ